MIRAILVDDEPLSLQLLEKKLTSTGEIEIAASYASAEYALQQMKQLDFQVAFLDIEMAGLSGLDLAEVISDWNPSIHIVFVTAYRDYAVQAFELNSIDYLLKPIMMERLEKTISRIKQMHLQKRFPENEHSPSLKINFFMEFSASTHKQIISWKTNKAKELFAYLFMHQDTYVHRDTLINDLWPEQDYKKAKIQLHTNLSYLRKTLESNGIRDALQFTNQSYRLHIEEYYCDAETFEKFIDENRITEENIKEAEQVLALYKGDYAEKNAYAWSIQKSKALKEKLLSLLQQLINFYTETNNNMKTQQYLQLLLMHDPYCEPAIRHLIQHHLNSGNRMEAIKVYQNFTFLLEEELGIQPEYATSNLLKNI
ncbi:response regulator [Bacillus sp. AGMB 02131]|uniref:Response regulator n=1 Tax=Peribacillus faecalis TaxID=2772559 RepID=A0A927CUW7_9BACI|nr:response regulator [Peribacillus faecalis]MBD3108028.1 response regulator [Peribacillus faecalis]